MISTLHILLNTKLYHSVETTNSTLLYENNKIISNEKFEL